MTSKPTISFSSRRAVLSLIAVVFAINVVTTNAQNFFEQPDEFDVRTSTQINAKKHSTCDVFQGKKLTLVRCGGAFELYNTVQLAQEMHTLTNYGETKAIIGVRQSLETGNTDTLTYLQDGKTVRTVYSREREGEQDEIVKTTLMNLNLSSGQRVTDMWVFDNIIAVRIDSRRFLFYEKPLIAGNYGDDTPYEVQPNENDQESNDDVDPNLVAYDFSIDEKSGAYELFGVSNATLHRYSFVYNEINRTLEMSAKTEVVSILDNKNVRMQVTGDLVIVTCGDCTTPAVTFFDRDLQMVEQFSLAAQIVDPYNIALYEDIETRSLQVYIAGRDSIDLIQRQRNQRLEVVWEKTTDVYTTKFNTTALPTHQITIGKGPNYVVFKEQSSPKLSIMPTCPSYAYYNNLTFTCDTCEPSEKSFGLQEKNCYPCLTLRFYSYQNDLDDALYDSICANGSVKSIILVVTTPFFVCLLGLICCCQTSHAESKRAASVKRHHHHVDKANRGAPHRTHDEEANLREDQETKRGDEKEKSHDSQNSNEQVGPTDLDKSPLKKKDVDSDSHGMEFEKDQRNRRGNSDADLLAQPSDNGRVSQPASSALPSHLPDNSDIDNDSSGDAGEVESLDSCEVGAPGGDEHSFKVANNLTNQRSEVNPSASGVKGRPVSLTADQ